MRKTRKRARPAQVQSVEGSASLRARRPGFPIVGIGASAGGLEAFLQLLKSLPSDTGMAFIFIQHLDPTHQSFLTQALAKVTSMPVLQVNGGTEVFPNHVYVIPPEADIALQGDELLLVARGEHTGRLHLPVDSFFQSLAKERGSQAIGVVLSGTASDGTEGLRAIKDEHGITLVQDPQSAKFSGMPQSAVNAGVVDHQLSLPLLADELVRLSRHPYLSKAPAPHVAGEAGVFEQILTLLRNSGGVDFGEYKPATIKRRLSRRMALRKFVTTADYLLLLRSEPKEVQALQEDLLIHVTSFFRDPEVFEALKQSIFPEMLRAMPDDPAVRIWVAGCSTGEEVYSLAIALLEFLDGAAISRPIQIFGTDISEEAVRFARLGVYPDAALHTFSEDQRRRFFVKVEGGYRVQKAIREMCVFVRHDLARDPPFAKLNLVSCRNVLIYFSAELQKRIVQTFHYCLREPGYLLLGRTESVVGFSRFFVPVDKVSNIFERSRLASTMRFAVPPSRQQQSGESAPLAGTALAHGRSAADISRSVDRLLLLKYAPPGAVVNQSLEVLQFRGRTGKYLEPAAGDPQSNLLKMARPGLLAPLRSAFTEAKKRLVAVRKEGTCEAEDGATESCAVSILPLTSDAAVKERLFLVLFEQAPVAAPARPVKHAHKRTTAKLEAELASTREYLQSLVEEHGRTNEDLASANEELVSSNEELQSLNEELETAKEELQSANEELITINDELHSANQQHHKANGDLVNLLDTVDLPVVILDVERRIRRFTPRARSLMNVLPSDVGRAIDDIKLNVEVQDLDERVAKAIATGVVDDSEVTDKSGRWHRMQIRPYKSPDGTIDGALVSLVDIDALKHTLRDAEWARDYAAGIVDAIQTPLIVLDDELHALSANEAFYVEFRLTPGNTEGKTMAEWGAAWNIPALWPQLEALFTSASGFQGFEVELSLGITRKWLSFSARMVDSRIGARMALLSIEVITDRKNAEAERTQLLQHAHEARDEAERANNAKDAFLATLSHELRTPLATMLMQAQLMRRGEMDAARVKHISEVMERCTLTQAQLIDDLLDTTRIVSGKLHLGLEPTDLALVVRTAIESVSGLAASKSISIELKVDRSPGQLMGDRVRLVQVFWNLLGNAFKFSPQHSQVTITLGQKDKRAIIEVSDNGAGIEAEFLPHVFTRFSQQDGTSSRRHGGLGLGLAIVRHIVELHGGTVAAESAGKGKGTTVRVTLPLSVQPLAAPLSLTDGAGSETEPEVELRGVRIMLVDDDPISRETVLELLTRTGAEVKGVGSAAEARLALDAFSPALIVSDIAMPDEDGYSFIESVRQSGKSHAHVPAVALSALASSRDRGFALSAGFQDHLAKPVDSDRLLRMLTRLTRDARKE